MKQKLSFLTDIIAKNEKNSNEKIQVLYECVEKSKSKIIQELVTWYYVKKKYKLNMNFLYLFHLRN
jgi:hypothetical protein